MPSSTSRPRTTTRRSPRPAPRAPLGRPAPLPERPQPAPFAAVFGVLVAAEDLYLAWLLWEPDPGWYWFVVLPVLLAAWAWAGAAMVWLGRARGWLVLAGAALLPLLLMVALVLLFGALGGGQALGWAVLLLAGPVGCLVLALQRPIREWTRPGRATRARGRGSRGAGSR